jgi:hypothetical protein
MHKACDLTIRAFENGDITEDQKELLSKIDSATQCFILPKIKGKTLSQTKKLIERVMFEQTSVEDVSKRKVRLRKGDLSEIRIDTKLLENILIAENLLKTIPHVNYCIGKCLTTPSFSLDDKTKKDLKIRLSFLKVYADKLLNYIGANELTHDEEK